MSRRLLDQLFAVPLTDGRHLVYAPLKRTAFIANAALVNRIHEVCARVDAGQGIRADGPPAEWVPADLGETHALLRRFDLLTPAPEPPDPYEGTGPVHDTVVLFPTNQCNLRCAYCYAEAGSHSPRWMAWEVARAAIDAVADSAKHHGADSLALGFHGGGEPSLHWDLLTRACDHARVRASENGMALVLNGAFNGFWSEETARYIRDTFTEISLSFDGLPDVQDVQRPTVSGEGSHGRVERTLELLDAAGFPYGIRLTATAETVDRLAESIDFIRRRFRPAKIQVEPVFSRGRAARNGLRAGDRAAFIDAYTEGKRIARSRGIELFYSGAQLEVLSRRFCLAASRALIVTPEGWVTTCFEIHGPDHPLGDEFIVGRYAGEGRFRIDERKRDHLMERAARRPDRCRGCFCRWHCAGDCAARWADGAGEDPDGLSDRCRLNQALILEAILEKIHLSDGPVWRDRPREPTEAT